MLNTAHVKYSNQDVLTNFWDLVESTIEKYADNQYIVTKSGQLTFKSTLHAINRIASILPDRQNTGQIGVGICLTDPLTAVPSMMGTLKAGHYFTSMDVIFPETTLQTIAESAGIKIIITDGKFINQARTIFNPKIKLVNFDDIDFSSTEYISAYICSPDDWAYILFTSGSTGEPKGAIGDYRYLSFAISSKFDLYAYTSSDRVLSLTSFSFSGAFNIYFLALFTGMTVCHFNVKENGVANLSVWMKEQQITRFSATVTVFRTWAGILQPDEKFPLVNSAHVGAEKRSPEDMEIIKRIFPNLQNFRIGFASTETQAITSCILPADYDFGNAEVPCGTPNEGIKIYIRDENGNNLPVGEEGEIVVYGDSLARGYINNPELTRKRFIPDPANPIFQYYRTGDLGKIREDGQLIHLGRIDNMVKLKGVRIELDSIDKHMRAYPGLQQSAFKVFDDRKGNKKLTAYLVAELGIKIPISDLRKFLAERLPSHLLPHFFIQLDEFPMTRTGKLNINQLPSPAMMRPPLSNPYVAPSTELESTLVSIWEEEVGVEGIGVTDDFFDIGGDSLIGVVLFIHIEQKLGRSLPVSTLLSASTIRAQAEIISQDNSSHDYSPVIPINTKGDNPPLFFIPGKGGYPTRIRNLAKLLDRNTPVYALQDLLGSNKYSPIKNIETIATFYLNEIYKIHPNGPYALVGESMGGKIAFEMAQQLKQQKKQVSLLAMLDTYHFPSSQMSLKKLSYIGMLINKHASVLLRASWQGKLDYLRFYKETMLDKVKRVLISEFDVALGKKKANFLQRNKRIERLNVRASDRYKVNSYPGRLIMFKALRGYHSDHPANGWDKVELGELIVHKLDCYHGSILFEPAVNELAKVLNNYINRKEDTLKS